MQDEIAQRLDAVLARLRAAEQRYGRAPGSVQLIAVSKTKPASAVRAAADAGQSDFAENYLQEGVDKVMALTDLPLQWHFIGPIQSNKTRPIAQHFHWVHSVDRLKIAQRLSEQRPAELPPLQVCLQVNVSGEQSKSGVTPAALPALAEAIAQLPRLRLRGLMAIPAVHTDFEQQRLPFRQLVELMAQLNCRGLSLDVLSMGMSDDLEAAIAEGSTHVRIGTAIFGARAYNP